MPSQTQIISPSSAHHHNHTHAHHPWPGSGPPSPERRRPPPPARGYSAAAATGQSRFVEGSMNDRVSAAPPAGFLGRHGHGHGSQRNSHERERERYLGKSKSSGLEGYTTVRSAGEGDGYLNIGGGGRYALRRPRSTAGWVKTQPAQQPAAQPQVTKKGSFWDGVRDKLLLRGSRSSGSIGRVVDMVVGGGGGGGRVDREGEKEKEREMEKEMEREREHKVLDMSGYPSKEEVLESYRNLVASGFFDKHAIRGGRHPAPGGNTPAKPSPNGKTFSDHMAEQHQQQRQKQQQQIKLALAIPPHRPSGNTLCSPPVLPPRTSSKGKLDGLLSPPRGTKRGASIDLAGDAETATRKLVKKLRHSASRISVEFGGSRENHHHYNYSVCTSSRPRLSTSSYAPSPMSPVSATFSPINPPSIMESVADTDEPMSPNQQHGRLAVKPKEGGGRRRRILGLGRKLRSPSPSPATATTDVDADVMMVDRPEQEQEYKLARDVTPPPPGFHSRSYSQRMRASSAGMLGMRMSGVQHHNQQQQQPLSVVPDPNQGIPVVPRIPSEFCAVPAAAVTVAVVAGEKKETKKAVEGKGKEVKNQNRDSGLGEDVENIPVWG